MVRGRGGIGNSIALKRKFPWHNSGYLPYCIDIISTISVHWHRRQILKVNKYKPEREEQEVLSSS